MGSHIISFARQQSQRQWWLKSLSFKLHFFPSRPTPTRKCYEQIQIRSPGFKSGRVLGMDSLPLDDCWETGWRSWLEYPGWCWCLGLGGSRLAARLEGHMTLDEDEVDQLRLLLSNIDGYSSYNLSTSSRRTRRRVQVMCEGKKPNSQTQAWKAISNVARHPDASSP